MNSESIKSSNKRKPTTYNLFIKHKMSQLKLNTELTAKEKFKLAALSWKSNEGEIFKLEHQINSIRLDDHPIKKKQKHNKKNYDIVQVSDTDTD